MSQRKLKKSKLKGGAPSRIRLGCVECLDTIVVPLDLDALQMSLWKGGKWVLSAEGGPSSVVHRPIFTGVVQPLCPACQDKHMDPELVRAAREIFSKRYDEASN